ncbi:MAG TPA: hypothetical protein VFI32_08550 [Rhodanobacteraceae bacterium]|nr:hypothetical protein [Rhodanobacteraceae bacterium]
MPIGHSAGGRVVIAYAVVARLLLQIASVVLPTVGTQVWVLKALIVRCLLCFSSR